MAHTQWHSLGLNEVKKRLSTDFNNGLSEKEAQKRLKKYGPNSFEDKKNFYYLKILWRQLRNPLVLILIVAGVITIFLKEYANSTVIFLAVFINTAMGVFQEGRASRAFEKLKKSQKKNATAVRGGHQKIIDSSELVPGDIIILQIGDQVPADARLLETKGLKANESSLTGEWMSVEKGMSKKIKDSAHITERKNMVWMNTLVTEGWARAAVVGTGFKTEIGKIAKFISEEDTVVTPLQKSIRHLARFLSVITVSVLVLLFAIGLLKGKSFIDMLLTSVALAVSAVPEGMPAAVTVVLAIGMQKLFAKGGLVKNLNAVETLGSASLILTDKTGTLTKAEMRIYKIMTLLSEDKKYKELEHKDRLHVLQMALMNAEAFIENPEDDLKEWIVRGKQLDRAIFLASIEAGLNPLEIFKKHKRIDFIPFDSERRYSASMYKEKETSEIYMMGAPEVILGSCSTIYKHGKKIKFGERERKIMGHALDAETKKGSRVIAVAYKGGGKGWGEFKNMTLGGIIAFHDPLRDDVAEYIQKAESANIRPVILTGDHSSTARKIAEETGILKRGGLLLAGKDLENIKEEELDKRIDKVDVFARVLPHQKMDIVKSWQRKGAVVAMTGDGVNDSPALRHADIGVALGSGTEVAKEAADLILLNDNFSIIVNAIQEGRRILDNLRKIIAYLLSTAFSEIVLISSAILTGLPLPILPAQILWVNIIGEGFMNFAFAFEPEEEGIMGRDSKKENIKDILTPNLKRLIFTIVSITSVFLVAIFFALYYLGFGIDKLRTIMFTAVSIGAIFFSFSMKNLKKPIWKIKIFSNKYLVFSLALSLALLFGALTLPPLQSLLSLVALSYKEMLFILFIGLVNLVSIELVKYFTFERVKKK